MDVVDCDGLAIHNDNVFQNEAEKSDLVTERQNNDILTMIEFCMTDNQMFYGTGFVTNSSLRLLV